MTRQPAKVMKLSWGVKQSFRNYVEMTGGTTEAGDGVERTEDGAFVFAASPDSSLSLDAEGKLQGTGTFLGEVKFDAHGGMLAVFLADPRLEVAGSDALLTVADSRERDRRVEIARLDLGALSSGESGDMVIPSALSVDGIQLLGDHYPWKTALDPVRLALAES